MPNQMSRELVHAFDKAAYNRQYYQKNKQYWQDYYETGATKPRSRSSVMDKMRPNSILKPGEPSVSKTKGNKKENKYAKKLLSIQKDGHGSNAKELSNKNVQVSKQKSKNGKSSVKKVVDSVARKVTKTANKAAKKTAKFLKKIFG